MGLSLPAADAIKIANALGEMRELAERWESRKMRQAGLVAATQLRDSPETAMARTTWSIADGKA